MPTVSNGGNTHGKPTVDPVVPRPGEGGSGSAGQGTGAFTPGGKPVVDGGESQGGGTSAPVNDSWFAPSGDTGMSAIDRIRQQEAARIAAEKARNEGLRKDSEKARRDTQLSKSSNKAKAGKSQAQAPATTEAAAPKAFARPGQVVEDSKLAPAANEEAERNPGTEFVGTRTANPANLQLGRQNGAYAVIDSDTGEIVEELDEEIVRPSAPPRPSAVKQEAKASKPRKAKPSTRPSKAGLGPMWKGWEAEESTPQSQSQATGAEPEPYVPSAEEVEDAKAANSYNSFREEEAEPEAEPADGGSQPPKEPPSRPVQAAEPEPEPAPEVIEMEDADDGSWKPRQTRDNSVIEESIERIMGQLRYGHMKIEGVKYDRKTNQLVIEPKLAEALEDARKFFGLRAWENGKLFKSVLLYYGVSSDRAGLLFGNEKGYIKSDIVTRALDGMKRNTLRTGYPFVHSTKDYFAGRHRFCITVVPNDIAVALCNENSQVPHTAAEMMDFGIREWHERVKPAIDAMADPDQKLVLMDMVDAIERINGTEYNLAYRMPGTDFTIHEAHDELVGYANVYEDPKQLAEANRKMEERLHKYTQEAAAKGKTMVFSEDGSLLRVSDVRRNPASWVLSTITKVVRSGALQNFVVGLTAIPEHAIGNIEHKFASALLSKAYGTNSVTDATFEIAKDPVVKNVLNDAFGAMASGNRDGLMAYLNEGGKLGDGRATQTLRQQMEGLSTTEKAQLLIDKAVNKYAAFGHSIASGRWFMQNADSKRFVQSLYFAIQRNDGNTMTPEQFERMLANDPAAFIEEYLKRPEGMDALLFAMDNTVGNVNVAQESLVRLQSKSAVTDFIISVFVSKFLVYGVNITGKLMPLSHTANFLASRGLAKGKNARQWQDLAMGGNRSFRDGLIQNLVMDAAWFGTRAGMLLLCYGLMEILGVDFGDEDDDDENRDDMDKSKRAVYGEVKIGGVRIEQNWMLHDLLGFTMPAALAVHAAKQGKDPWLIFQDGAMDVAGAMPWLKMSAITDGVVNFDRNLIEAQEEAREQWGDQAPTDTEYMIVKAQTYGLSMLANFIEHPIARMAYGEDNVLSPNSKQASTTRIYTEDPNDEDDATTKTTWADAQFRQLARNSWTAAMLLNWATGVGTENQGVQRTGYLKEQMPLVEVYDAAQSYWNERWDVPDDISDEDMVAKCDDIIGIVRMYDNPAQIAADGIIIPYRARQATVDYLQAQVNALYNEHNRNKATPGYYSGNGLSYEENSLNRNRDYEMMQLKIQELKQIQSRLWDNRIPYTPTKYNQWANDWKTAYYDAEGNPVGPIDNALASLGELFGMGENPYTAELYASGNHKSSALPFLTVDDRYGTYDAQTPSAWWDDSLSDMGRLQELYGDAVLTEGMHAGKNVYEMLSGEGAVGSEGKSLTGQRALIPVPESYSDRPELLAGDRDDAWNPLGEMGVKDAFKTDSASGSSWGSGSYNSYGGYRSSYRSGGGGGSSRSYNPSIYSHAAYSLNADKPATMYAKTPYEARYDYLRPGFETKGSREAYKRQDF